MLEVNENLRIDGICLFVCGDLVLILTLVLLGECSC